jgi:hypothetical protein
MLEQHLYNNGRFPHPVKCLDHFVKLLSDVCKAMYISLIIVTDECATVNDLLYKSNRKYLTVTRYFLKLSR